VVYRQLVDDVRRRLAEDLLARRDLGVEQIGQRLGYGSPSAFSNAFRRWHGVSPRDYRARTGPAVAVRRDIPGSRPAHGEQGGS
jgi:AraC-like DNA-binding protein